jgi:hypothetical protein
VATPAPSKRAAQVFWVYKRGLLVLRLSSEPGVLLPTRGALVADQDPDGLMTPHPFLSGQFLSLEWEPRVRVLLGRSRDLVDFVELLEDRRYAVDLEPPAQRVRPFRFL